MTLQSSFHTFLCNLSNRHKIKQCISQPNYSKLFLVSEYFHMYQISTSFDFGVFTDDFSLGLSYHKDVEEVYKSITATGQAVGKSKVHLQ